MKPGDVVRFKAGLAGIPEGANVGIWLDRVKRKKAYYVVLWTAKGRQEVKTEHVGERLFTATLVDPSDEKELKARLAEALERFGKQRNAREEKRAVPAVRGKGELDEREAWLELKELGRFTVGRAAEVLFDRVPPSPEEVQRTREMLERCVDPGVGYFEKEGKEWVALAPEDYGRVKRAVEGLHRLKKRLVVTVEEEIEGETWLVARGVPLDSLELTEEEAALLDLAQGVMEDFLLHDTWRGKLGLAGTRIHAIDGFHLFSFVKWLASDWLQGGAGRTVSSHFAEFLVESGRLSVEQGIRLLARRLVLQSDGFAWETPRSIAEEADRLAERVDAMGPYNRRDLRHLATFTIDPPTAKDFDDAITYLPRDDGGATLWVHIADVSHYVAKDTLLDRHARDRGTSVYLPTGVLPMLPPRLSDDLCSLRGGTDRPALSVRLDVDAQGRISGEAYCESLIRLTKNYAYGEVDEAIATGSEPFAGLNRICRAMRSRREGLDLDTGEREIRLDENEITHGEKRASPATQLIEVLMVAANEAVARLLTKHDVPTPYRCHPLPDRGPVTRFNGQMETMGLDIRIDLPEATPGAGTAGDEDEVEGPSLVDQLKGGKFTLMGGSFVKEKKPERERAGRGGAGEGGAGRPGGGDEGQGAGAGNGGAAGASATGATGTDGPATDADAAERAEKAARTVISTGIAQLSDGERAAWLSPFSRALARVRDVPEKLKRDLVTLLLLRTLGRALYTPANYGHFGLGSTCYCHFTSPIRRYPDLLVHRQLRWLLRRLAGTSDDPAPNDIPVMDAAPPTDEAVTPSAEAARAPEGETPRAPAEAGAQPARGEEERPHEARHLAPFCDVSTDRAVAAERLEWKVKDIALTFASRGEPWQGTLAGVVSGVVAAGLYLTLPGGLEAFLPARDIPGGPWSVDDHGSMLFVGSLERPEVMEEVKKGNWRALVDEASGETRIVAYKLGDQARVRISGRDYAEGRVNVVLAQG